jgi:hypothetical protein
MKKHGFTHTSVEHHADRSHTVHHSHGDGSSKDVKHAAGDLDAVHDSLQENLNPSTPQPGSPAAAAPAAPEAGAAQPSMAAMPGPAGV